MYLVINREYLDINNIYMYLVINIEYLVFLNIYMYPHISISTYLSKFVVSHH